jgi:hypothetical protein
MLAAYVREVFPISRPFEQETGDSVKRSALRRGR